MSTAIIMAVDHCVSVAPVRRCKLTGHALPAGSTARREYATDRARVLAGKLRDIENVCAELEDLCATNTEKRAVRAALWRAGNLLRVSSRGKLEVVR